MFEQLKPAPTNADRCADALRRSILSGELETGVRLPPERTLAESFGVNRVTVRSALTRLLATGLVSVRQGSGYVVRDFTTDGGPELVPGIIELALGTEKLKDVLGDLLFVRRHMARALLERLFEVASEADLAHVDAAIDTFDALAQSDADPEQCAHADVAVISALLDASHSAVLRLCLNPVVTMVGRLPKLRTAIYMQPRANVAGWRGLVATLRRGDSGAIDEMLGALAQFDRLSLRQLEELA